MEWGTTYKDLKPGGHWTTDQQDNHINNLELVAAICALKTFTDYVVDCSLELMIDTTTAITGSDERRCSLKNDSQRNEENSVHLRQRPLDQICNIRSVLSPYWVCLNRGKSFSLWEIFHCALNPQLMSNDLNIIVNCSSAKRDEQLWLY